MLKVMKRFVFSSCKRFLMRGLDSFDKTRQLSMCAPVSFAVPDGSDVLTTGEIVRVFSLAGSGLPCIME
jgi:hypothetical protein